MGGEICAKRKFFLLLLLELLGGGANLNCKFKTFGFLDVRHKYSATTTLSLLQRKLAEKNIVSKKSTFYVTVIISI